MTTTTPTAPYKLLNWNQALASDPAYGLIYNRDYSDIDDSDIDPWEPSEAYEVEQAEYIASCTENVFAVAVDDPASTDARYVGSVLHAYIEYESVLEWPAEWTRDEDYRDEDGYASKTAALEALDINLGGRFLRDQDGKIVERYGLRTFRTDHWNMELALRACALFRGPAMATDRPGEWVGIYATARGIGHSRAAFVGNADGQIDRLPRWLTIDDGLITTADYLDQCRFYEPAMTVTAGAVTAVARNVDKPLFHEVGRKKYLVQFPDQWLVTSHKVTEVLTAIDLTWEPGVTPEQRESMAQELLEKMRAHKRGLRFNGLTVISADEVPATIQREMDWYSGPEDWGALDEGDVVLAEFCRDVGFIYIEAYVARAGNPTPRRVGPIAGNLDAMDRDLGGRFLRDENGHIKFFDDVMDFWSGDDHE